MSNNKKRKQKAWPDWWRTAPHLFPFLLIRVRLARLFYTWEQHTHLLWAALVGVVGGLSSVLFKNLLDVMSHTLTGGDNGGVSTFFTGMPLWFRVAIPTLGGLVAGLILQYGGKRNRHHKETSTDYMEAMVLGQGDLSPNPSLMKIASSTFSIASGASIGREGPMVQLSSLAASLLSQLRGWSITRRRMILACGAAAGIASAYHAPIAGALFVAEIILGSIAMETLGPLLLSSVMATQTVRFLTGGDHLYVLPSFSLNSGMDLLHYMILGILIGLTAPWFLRALRGSERFFSYIRLPLFTRIGLGGLTVGLIALTYPQVCGNGYREVNAILNGQWLWPGLAVLVVLKLLATCASFGSGAVGGVFTPTLFMGAGLGYLFGLGTQSLGLGSSPEPVAFALIGMGMFLAATTHAPLMAILMIFEMTLNYQLILPLMLGSVVAYFIATSLEPQSIYSDSLRRKGAVPFGRPLDQLAVSDLMKATPVSVTESVTFSEIARHFIVNSFRYLYVTDQQGTYLGAICLDDVKTFLSTEMPGKLVIARDLLTEGPPPISVTSSLVNALTLFTNRTDRIERLPVVSDDASARLLGSLTKTDLLLAMAGANRNQRE